MYENSKRFAAGKELAQGLATAEATIRSQAERAGVSTGVVRTLLQLAAMRASGAQVTAADMARAELVSEYTTDITLAEAKRAGWVESRTGKLSITSAGRQVVADVGRGWERAARKLAAFSSALPFRKRAAKRSSDQA